MHRIDTPSAQKDKFGVGKNGFTRGNPQTGTAATKLDNDYFDSIQEEICGVIEGAGIALDKTKRTQLAESINKLIGNSKAPAASTTVAGIVQLNSAINSIVENQAATPMAVKTAYDLANKAKSTAETDASTTVKGRVQLNSAINSTVENQAATPGAVKKACDLANLANNNANNKVPTSRTINGKALTTNISLSASDVGASTLGVGQKWYDVTSSRAVNVTYTNSTGKPIMLAMLISKTGSPSSYFTVDGVSLLVSGNRTDTAERPFSLIIPAGSTYMATENFRSWNELR